MHISIVCFLLIYPPFQVSLKEVIFCPYVCVFICNQDNLKSSEWNLMNLAVNDRHQKISF